MGDCHGLSKSSIYRNVRDVTNSINAHLFNETVFWREDAQVSNAFFAKTGFSNVCGCIDGTHIKILTPSQNEE